MRKKELVQLLQFILAWVLLGLFIVFVMEKSFIDFILKYWLYLLIVSISYFYYYSIEYEPDKKYKLIRNAIIYANAYLFLHIFFRPLLNISHQLFILLWLITLWMWWTTTLTTRRKHLLQIIWWIFSFFILISWALYFYPDAPDIQWFLENRNNEIKILWVNNPIDQKEAYIKITNSINTENFEIQPNFTKILSENSKIAYPSLENHRDEKLIIITSPWDVIWIFPQSEIQVEFEWQNPKKIEKLNWKIWFLSWIFESNIEILWNDELSSEEQNWLIWIQETYKYNFVSYLKNQISESKIGLANNTIMYNIDGVIIRILAKMFPVTFGKNLDNYNEFQKYFTRIDGNSIDLGRYETKQWSWYSIDSLRVNIKDNIDIWKSNTYWWLKKPEIR